MSNYDPEAISKKVLEDLEAKKQNQATDLVDKLEELGYFKYVEKEGRKEKAKDTIRKYIRERSEFEPGQEINQMGNLFRSFDLRWYYADAENLMVGDVKLFFDRLSAILTKMNIDLLVEEIATEDESYKIKVNGEIYELYSADEASERNNKYAPLRIMIILNEIFRENGMKERAYGRSLDNDQMIAVLTPKMKEAINEKYGKDKYTKIYGPSEIDTIYP